MNNLIIFEIEFKNNSYMLEIFNKNIFNSIEDAIKNILDLSVLPLKQINIHIFKITNNIEQINYDELDKELNKRVYDCLYNNKRYPIRNIENLLNIQLQYDATYIRHLTSIF